MGKDIPRIDTHWCTYCKKNPVKYILDLSEDVVCSRCKHVKYAQGSIFLNICSTLCDGLYWSIDTYLTHKSNPHPKFMFCLEKDECNMCGQRDHPRALFSGIRKNVVKPPHVSVRQAPRSDIPGLTSQVTQPHGRIPGITYR